jgi:hypothetical protein
MEIPACEASKSTAKNTRRQRESGGRKSFCPIAYSLIGTRGSLNQLDQQRKKIAPESLVPEDNPFPHNLHNYGRQMS